MEVKKVLRNLVTNQFMDDFDYAGTEFSFKTVFHFGTLFSYCMCTCAFEHEFVDYISDTGAIDEEKYEKIEACIIDGKCPHVHQVPEKFVKDTSIYGIHIASAVGTIDALVKSLPFLRSRNMYTCGQLYHMDPFYLALLKNNKDKRVMSVIRRHCRKWYIDELITANKTNDDRTLVSFQETDVLDFLAGSENLSLIEGRVFTVTGSTRSRSAVVCNNDIQHDEDLYHCNFSIEHEFDNYPIDKRMCIFFPIHHWTLFYDHAVFFKRQLNFIEYSGFLHITTEYAKKLNFMTKVFKSTKCQNVLQSYGYGSQDDQCLCATEQVKLIFDALFMSPSIMKETARELLRKIPDLNSVIKALAQLDGDRWNYPLRYNTTLRVIRDPEVLKIILDCGIDLNNTDSSGATPLIDILGNCLGHSNRFIDITRDTLTIRQSVELYLFENIDINLNQKAVTLSVEIDALLLRKSANMDQLSSELNFRLIGGYMMDVSEHSIFGHDETDSFALNFMLPLLLECGFQMENISLMLDKNSLHPREKQYLQSFISSPRSLKFICRNSLRQHFKGRQIHSYVKRTNMPKSIGDFILLRSLLKAVPKQLLE